MKNTTFILVLLMFIASAAQAEVFKCRSSTGKTVYQEQPCPPSTSQGVVTIEAMDPAKQAEAKKKLAEWKADFAAREATEKKAQQEKQMELERLAHIEALNRSAVAQQELAEAVEQATDSNPYGPYNNFWPFRFIRPPRHGHHQDHNQDHDPDPGQNRNQLQRHDYTQKLHP